MGAQDREFGGFPKGVVGDLARDRTDRPKELNLKAKAFTTSTDNKSPVRPTATER